MGTMIKRQSESEKKSIEDRKQLAQLLVEAALDRAMVLGVSVVHGSRNGRFSVVVKKQFIRYRHEDELGY